MSHDWLKTAESGEVVPIYTDPTCRIVKSCHVLLMIKRGLLHVHVHRPNDALRIAIAIRVTRMVSETLTLLNPQSSVKLLLLQFGHYTVLFVASRAMRVTASEFSSFGEVGR